MKASVRRQMRPDAWIGRISIVVDITGPTPPHAGPDVRAIHDPFGSLVADEVGVQRFDFGPDFAAIEVPLLVVETAADEVRGVGPPEQTGETQALGDDAVGVKAPASGASRSSPRPG